MKKEEGESGGGGCALVFVIAVALFVAVVYWRHDVATQNFVEEHWPVMEGQALVKKTSSDLHRCVVIVDYEGRALEFIHLFDWSSCRQRCLDLVPGSPVDIINREDDSAMRWGQGSDLCEGWWSVPL
jgi:hypothetical protein